MRMGVSPIRTKSDGPFPLGNGILIVDKALNDLESLRTSKRGRS